MMHEEGRKGYIIAVLLSNLSKKEDQKQKLFECMFKEAPSGIKMYLKMYNYIDARTYDKNKKEVRRAIRFAMPSETQIKVPINNHVYSTSEIHSVKN